MSVRSLIRTAIGRGNLYITLRKWTMSYRRWRWGMRNVDRLAWVHRWADVRPDLKAGPYSFVSFHCLLMNNVSIGKYSMLAPRVSIVGVDHLYDIPGVPATTGQALVQSLMQQIEPFTRSGSVSNPLSITQALKGLIPGPVCRK